MSVVRYMSDRIGVLFHGEMVEEGETEQIFEFPKEAIHKNTICFITTIVKEKGG